MSVAQGPLLHSGRPSGSAMNDLGKASAYVALFSEIGFVLLATVLGGVLGGDWLDRRLGTTPILALIGFGLGTSAGAIADWRLLSRFLARMDEADKASKE